MASIAFINVKNTIVIFHKKLLLIYWLHNFHFFDMHDFVFYIIQVLYN